jgi:hypothetical protein
MQTALTMSALCQPRGFVVKTPSQQKTSAIRGARFVVRAEAAEAKVWSAPALNPNTPSPIFGGSTGTLRCCFVRPRSGIHTSLYPFIADCFVVIIFRAPIACLLFPVSCSSFSFF